MDRPTTKIKKKKRPCPACKPGIYCAACRGRGHSPRIRIDATDREAQPLVMPALTWKWPGLYRGARFFETQMGDLMPGGEDTVPDGRGDQVPATVKRRAAARAVDPGDDESHVDPVAAFFGDHRSGGYFIESGAQAGADASDIDPAEVRRYVGISQEEFEAAAKRRSRAPLTGAERAARQVLARRVAQVLDEATHYNRRTGAMTVLCAAYGTSRVVLGRLQREGRLR